MAKAQEFRELPKESCPHCAGSGHRPKAPELAQWLRNCRISKGFAQRAFARAAGFSPTHLKDCELGRRRPSPEMLARYLAALGVEP